MDTNGLPIEGYPLPGTATGMPIGMGLALAGNTAAMNEYAGMTETEKEHLIMRCRDARSRDEMHEIVDSIAYSESVGSILEEAKEQNNPL